MYLQNPLYMINKILLLYRFPQVWCWDAPLRYSISCRKTFFLSNISHIHISHHGITSLIIVFPCHSQRFNEKWPEISFPTLLIWLKSTLCMTALKIPGRHLSETNIPCLKSCTQLSKKTLFKMYRKKCDSTSQTQLYCHPLWQMDTDSTAIETVVLLQAISNIHFLSIGFLFILTTSSTHLKVILLIAFLYYALNSWIIKYCLVFQQNAFFIFTRVKSILSHW